MTLKFGLPAILAAIPGAWFLTYLSHFPPLVSYHFFQMLATVEFVKIITGILLIIFATLELHTIGKSAFFNIKWLPIGGLISGFFGGLSGQQGAFRSSFLLHAGLNKEQFVSTNASIAVGVDVTRLLVYGITFRRFLDYSFDPALLFATILAAFFGVLLGIIGLKKITFNFIQRLVAVLLYLLGILLLFGII